MTTQEEPRTSREALPEPGQLVRVRSRSWLVEEVAPAARPSEQTLVRLSCLDDDAQGEDLSVLWEREVDAAAGVPALVAFTLRPAEELVEALR